MEPTELTTRSRPQRLIYVVEDDPDVSRLIEHSLRTAGYETSAFATGSNVIPTAVAVPPTLFILDIMLPEVSGFELCRQIRQNQKLRATPIIVVSARTDEVDRLRAFEVGADAYISKPFLPRELIARIRNIALGDRETPDPEVIQLAHLEIDVGSMTLRVGGRAVPTTVREFRLLEYLIKNRGRVFSRHQLLDAVWKNSCFVTPRSIDVFIQRLREKIESDPRHPRLLKTLRGIGYRFDARAE